MKEYRLPCESLDGAWETGSHARARGGCHVSTFSGRGVTTSHKEIMTNYVDNDFGKVYLADGQ